MLGSIILAVEAVTVVVMAVADRRLVTTGRGDVIITLGDPAAWLLLIAAVAAAGVGCVVAVQQPRHPVGWLFLGLSVAMLASGAVDEWYAFSSVGAGTLPGGDIAATIGDRIFIPWFTAVALVLLLTPTGRYLSPRWRLVGRTTIVASGLGVGLGIIGDGPLESYPGARNPFTIAALNPAARVGGLIMVLIVGACLLAGAASLVVRFRRAAGDERRQLLWLLLAVVPLPVFVVASFVAASRDEQWLTLVTAAAFLTAIPVAAGLSVARYRLYDVERVVALTLTYSLLTAVLMGLYVGLVWAGAQLSRGWAPSPVAAATVGAVTAALLAAPLRRGLQDRLDRRFNRRSYDARRVVADGLAVEQAGIDVEALLRHATGDPDLTVAFPGPDGMWLRADGAPADAVDAAVEVARGGRVVARIGYDAERTGDATMRQLAGLVASELDNTRLRSELAAKVAEVEESRRRIARAQRDERRRIERDLHDGAQQSLLALAFRLQAAALSGEPDALQAALRDGASDAGAAARELRALANGLHPQALTEGGLPAVLDDLARSSPVAIRVSAEVDRVEPGVEFTTWLVIAEAVVNAQKHSGAGLITIDVNRDQQLLRFRVADDGRGGADVTSNGLLGLVDRVDAARGVVTVTTGADGTVIEGALPCAS